MGVVINDIQKKAPLDEELMAKIDSFRNERNWLVHDFDAESTPYIHEKEKVEAFGERIFEIMSQSNEINWDLDRVGQEMERQFHDRLVGDVEG